MRDDDELSAVAIGEFQDACRARDCKKMRQKWTLCNHIAPRKVLDEMMHEILGSKDMDPLRLLLTLGADPNARGKYLIDGKKKR